MNKIRLFACMFFVLTLTTGVNAQDGISTDQKVDLGLSVCWAGWNVGASSPEEYGDYYAWGETTTKDVYSWRTYKWCEGRVGTLTKYCSERENGVVDSKTVLDPADDVAAVQWGGGWRLPTELEFYELINHCTWTWTTYNSVKGYKVTGPNGNSIFMPAAGWPGETGPSDCGSYGYYWSGTLNGIDSNNVFFLTLSRRDCIVSAYGDYRCTGHTVRPVCNK